MPKLLDVRQGTAEWLEARKGKITASLAAACLGLDPHKGPLAAFNEITGRKRQPDNPDMRYGREFEAEAVSVYEAETGTLVEPGGFWVHPELTWLGASPDGLVGTMGLLEAKCPQTLPSYTPRHHEVQCVVQLAVTGRLYCHYFAYCRPEHVMFTVCPSCKDERELLTALEAFYHTYIITDTPPPRRRKKEKL
jgi:putative phage-type endonuclease